MRAKKHITQEKLAEFLGVSYQAVSRWENDTSYPDIELLPELASYFGVTIEVLLGVNENEKASENMARELYNSVLENPLDENNILLVLDKLRDLERQYPNNLTIKEQICEILIFSSNKSPEEILPEVRRYTKAAMDAFSDNGEGTLKWFYRYMVLLVPENEVTEWASKLPEFDLNLRNNVMKLRYQHRKEYEKAREYECLEILYNLREITTLGPLSEIEYNPKEGLFASRLAVNTIDTVVGVPYYDADGRIHNSIMLYERLNPLFTEAILNIGSSYFEGTEEEIKNGFATLEKAVEYSILYADAVKEESFVSDNPHLTPQKAGDHKYMDIGEENNLREHSLDMAIAFLTGKGFENFKDDERFKHLCDRIFKKKAEIVEYWKNQTA